MTFIKHRTYAKALNVRAIHELPLRPCGKTFIYLEKLAIIKNCDYSKSVNLDRTLYVTRNGSVMDRSA
jgi:hypothetical protein